MSQDQINQLLIDHAKQGKRVVRLKGGDPFVFGRGGEEAEALAAAKIAFEVVPGITAAIAGPAYAGIPVTHRDFNSSFTLITGHEKEEEYKEADAVARGAAVGSSDLDWAAIARLPCVAFYMGVKSLPRICAKLIEHGKPANTPAATIQWATRPDQRTCIATLADLPQRVAEQKIGAPAITIIGKVVTMRATINWFESRPLFGQTIVVTRTRQQASELTAKLSELGANVIEAPTIELHPPANWAKVDEALKSPADWIVCLTSGAMVVRYTRDRLRDLNLEASAFSATQRLPRSVMPRRKRSAMNWHCASICCPKVSLPKRLPMRWPRGMKLLASDFCCCARILLGPFCGRNFSLVVRQKCAMCRFTKRAPQNHCRRNSLPRSPNIASIGSRSPAAARRRISSRCWDQIIAINCPTSTSPALGRSLRRR